MFTKSLRAALFSVLMLSFGTTVTAPVVLAREGLKVDLETGSSPGSDPLGGSDNSQSARFASIDAAAQNLSILAESATVSITRDPKISEIIVYSNCPRNWSLKGWTLRQVGFSGEARRGTSLFSDALGSRAVVNGQVFVFPDGPMKGLKLGPDGVFANGQKIEPLKGSEIPCNCSGDDRLEIKVPATFSGGLKIGCTGNSRINIDSWKDGSLELVLLGNSSLNAGKLASLPKFVLDSRSKGSADIADLEAGIFVANLSGQQNGSIRVKHGSSKMSNATVEGNGTIELHGDFKKLQQLVNGGGKIEVNP